MGIFSAITGIIGASKMKKASKKAQAAQIAAMQKAQDEENQRFNLISGQYQPYQQAGTAALGQYGDLLGTGTPEAQQAAIDRLKASPFYQSLYRTGQEAVLQNASATGGLRGGNTERGLADFGSDTLMKTIQQQLEGLGGMANMGLGATGQVAGFGSHTSDIIAQLMTGQGQAAAQGAIQRGNISANMWSGIGGGLDQAAAFLMPASLGGAGGLGKIGSFLGGGGAPTMSAAGTYL